MEWFLITCHNSKPIGTRGLRVLRWTGVFFKGLGWDGDGGGGRERTSPPRLICRGTGELTGERGTGDVDTKGNFTLPPSHVVLWRLLLSLSFLTKSKKATGCRKLWEQKAYMSRFAFLTTYPAKRFRVDLGDDVFNGRLICLPEYLPGILDFCCWTVTFVLRGLSVAITP